MTRAEAYKELIDRLIKKSGYSTGKAVEALLHLDNHEPTEERVNLLSRGFSGEKTEFLLKAGVDHHCDKEE